MTFSERCLIPGNREDILRICGGSSIGKPEKWWRDDVEEVPYYFPNLEDIIEEVVTQAWKTPGVYPSLGRDATLRSSFRPAASRNSSTELLEVGPIRRLRCADDVALLRINIQGDLEQNARRASGSSPWARQSSRTSRGTVAVLIPNDGRRHIDHPFGNCPEAPGTGTFDTGHRERLVRGAGQ